MTVIFIFFDFNDMKEELNAFLFKGFGSLKSQKPYSFYPKRMNKHLSWNYKKLNLGLVQNPSFRVD